MRKEISSGSWCRNIAEAMSGKAVSSHSPCQETLTFIYGILPENNELWPSPLWYLQTPMLRKETSPSSWHALWCPPETEVWTLFLGIVSVSYESCPDVLSSALEQHSWASLLYLQSFIQTERAGMSTAEITCVLTLCTGIGSFCPWNSGQRKRTSKMLCTFID